MVLNWFLFAVLGALAYVGFSIMGQFSDTAARSWFEAAANLFIKPPVLAALIIGNALWVVALYYGLRESKDAIPMLVAVGVIASFAYSAVFLGAEVTPLHIAGLTLVLLGIYLLV